MNTFFTFCGPLLNHRSSFNHFLITLSSLIDWVINSPPIYSSETIKNRNWVTPNQTPSNTQLPEISHRPQICKIYLNWILGPGSASQGSISAASRFSFLIPSIFKGAGLARTSERKLLNEIFNRAGKLARRVTEITGTTARTRTRQLATSDRTKRHWSRHLESYPARVNVPRTERRGPTRT